MPRHALIVVDMQNYYLRSESAFARFQTAVARDALEYLHRRCYEVVVPNIRRLIDVFHIVELPVIFLRLNGRRQDRQDLHHIFRETHLEALEAGFGEIYPLEGEPIADIIDELEPGETDIVLNKTTFSAFTSTPILEVLEGEGIDTLVMTGLVTSQCVETTARDASDHGYRIVMIEDAQADYNETLHRMSLISSRGVCGGHVVSTQQFLGAGE